MPELRKDPIIGRWVIISTERGRRPSSFTSVSKRGSAKMCPFCPGHEDNTPPEITLSSDPPLVVDAASLRLQGVVTDADRVLDMYIFVGSRKVFYLSNREGRDRRRMTFDTHLPLESGSVAGRR